MKKFKVLIAWTQEMSIEREIEAKNAKEAAELALEIDPNDVDPSECLRGDIVSDVETMVDGDQVGVNNCPFEEE
jgi:hypothetical protein